MAIDTPPEPKRRTRKKVAAVATAPKRGERQSMSAEHKQALAEGRDESRAVRRYLEAVEASKPKRGRKRTAETIQRRIEAIDEALQSADPLSRVHLVQERMNLEAEIAATDEVIDISELEDAFVAAAAGYSYRKGIGYAAWREIGVDPKVLRRAGIARTRS